MSAQLLEIFSQALVSDWENEIYIDTFILNDITDFVCNQQDQRTGAFIENTPFIEDVKLQVSHKNGHIIP